MNKTWHGQFLVLMAPTLIGLAACGAANETSAGRLALVVQSATTGADGKRCELEVAARNDTGAAALNVQAAWMAQTEGFGSISDFQMLGDVAAGEERSVKLGIFGAPCDAIRDLKLTRAVCRVGPPQDPPQSCADLVVLDGGGVLTVR